MDRIIAKYSSTIQNQNFKRAVYATGIISLISIFIKFIFTAKRYYNSKVLIRPFLQKLRPSEDGRKEWMTLLFLDSVGQKELSFIEELSKYVNLIIVWENESISNYVFDQLDLFPNFHYRIVTFEVEENFNKFMQLLTEEIEDVHSDYLIVQHRSYTGVTPWDKSEPTLTFEQMSYFRKKLDIYSMCVNGFLKAKRTSVKLPIIFLEIEHRMKATFDRFLAKTFENFVNSLDARNTFKFQRVIM